MFLRAADDGDDERGVHGGLDIIDRQFLQSGNAVRETCC